MKEYTRSCLTGSGEGRRYPGCRGSTANKSHLQMVRLCEVTLFDDIVMRAMNDNELVYTYANYGAFIYYNTFVKLKAMFTVARICRLRGFTSKCNPPNNIC